MKIHFGEYISVVKKKVKFESLFPLEQGLKNKQRFKMGVIKTKTMVRRELFDSLNLPEEFLIRDYKKAIEEKGINVLNSSVLYADMIILQKKGKVARLEKKRRGISVFKIIKREEIGE